ncbi:MAG: outer membrane beta-barrel family protein [Cruoricaptor ignavus]|nr:outer membrane beta-barrel family protein [Cruoricaptor ignavus]
MKTTITLLSFLAVSMVFAQNKDSIRTSQIKEVTLVGKKQPLEQTNKGVVLNVAGTTLQQRDNVAEVLKFAPNVSHVGGLNILGSQRIQIVLNGKEVKIKPEQFQTFLSSLDAKSVRSIEVVDKPDASLDSKYTSQILINTKTVKGVEASLGMGTTYNFKFGQNVSGGVSANFGKLSIYSSGNFSQGFSEFHGNNALRLHDNSFNRTGTQYGDLKRLGYSGIINFNYDFNNKNSLSLLYDYTADEDLDKKFNYDYQITTPMVSDSTTMVRNRFESRNKTHTVSLQYLYNDENKGRQLTISTDYASDQFANPFNSQNLYFRNSILQSEENITQNGSLSYNLFTASADYKKTLNEKNNYAFGLKYSNSANLNILDYFDGNQFVYDNSQHFDFYENIYSAYLRYTYKPGKLTYNLGLRNEYTDNNFRTNKNQNGQLSYNNLLPTLQVVYRMNPNHTISFYTAKRISRPAFFSYDPTVFFSPPNEKSSGNESLKPVKTYIAQSQYVYRRKYAATLLYAYSVDNIVNIPSYLSDGFIHTKPENGGYQNQLLLNLSIPLKVTKFWQSSNKFNFIYRDFRLPQLNEFYKAFFTTIESTQTFTLPKNILVDLSLSYRSPGQNKATYLYSNFVSNISTSVPLFNKKANLRFGMNDIFNTDRRKYDTDINGIYQFEYMKFRTRQYFVKFTYYFKSGKEIDGEIRDTEIGDLINRTGK